MAKKTESKKEIRDKIDKAKTLSEKLKLIDKLTGKIPVKKK